MARRKTKDARWDDIDGGKGFVIPATLLTHPNFIRLSPYAVKLLMDAGRQFTGFNNGYLCVSWRLMQSQGWNSSATLAKATQECEHYGLLIRTRQGGQNQCNLHALGWRRIDHKEGQTLDVGPTQHAPNPWKKPTDPFINRPTARRKLRKAA